MNGLQLLAYKPCRRIKPVDRDDELGQQEVDPVLAVDVLLLVGCYHHSGLLVVAQAHDDVTMPAEWCDFVVIGEYYDVASVVYLGARCRYTGYAQPHYRRVYYDSRYSRKIDNQGYPWPD